MAGGKHKNRSNRNQGYLASSEPNSPTIVSPGSSPPTITPEKQDMDLKSLLMEMMEDFKKEINNSLKEIQENTGKQLEALKEETQQSLKELQEVFCRSTWGSHLGSWIPQRLVCTGESVDYRS